MLLILCFLGNILEEAVKFCHVKESMKLPLFMAQISYSMVFGIVVKLLKWWKIFLICTKRAQMARMLFGGIWYGDNPLGLQI